MSNKRGSDTRIDLEKGGNVAADWNLLYKMEDLHAGEKLRMKTKSNLHKCMQITEKVSNQQI